MIEETEPSDPEEDDESESAAENDSEREEGSRRGRLEELRKMQEFKLVCGWRKDGVFSSSVGFKRNALSSGAVVMWSKTFEPCSLADHERDCGCRGRESWLGSVDCGCNECVLHAAEDEDICGECVRSLVGSATL